ncbi:hypothetical protein F4819DRAFT_504057 [Hypoxylon fuscum]|nr:hypothetical protein F4819DRAFT_504057 [Hypoxylon fuscum]
MSIIKHLNISAFAFLLAASLVAATNSDAFNVGKCPTFYLSDTEKSDTGNSINEFIAVCFMENGTSQEYRSSKINLDHCFVNHDAVLKTADDTPAGLFSTSCEDCGLAVHGPLSAKQEEWTVSLGCKCAHSSKMKSSVTKINIDSAIQVNKDGIVYCFGVQGEEITNSTDTHPSPKMPLRVPVPTTSTPGIASSIAISTVTSSSSAPSVAATTKKRKTKTKKKTKTMTKTTQSTTVFARFSTSTNVTATP